MTERQAIVAKLAEVLEAETGASPDAIRESEDLPLRDGLNIDSVDLIGMVMRVEEFYRIRMTHEELARVVTVRDLVDLIQSKRAASVATAA
ncbi:MAG: acyl carrier protein [Zavarzinella sp.]|nr:acyl carrier protein [Zavarzinella sp.]